jgi:hypothetical protein
MVEEERAIIRRIYAVAAAKIGSAAHLAEHLNVSYADLRAYLAGEAAPSDEVLLRTVDLLLEELPALRREFSPGAWRALSLPR